jgi:hypothetical protein
MSLLATPLAFLVFFSGFAVAQISAPNCYSEWAWVCILSFPQGILWPIPDLTAFSLVIQFSWPKSVFGRSDHVGDMQWGL